MRGPQSGPQAIDAKFLTMPSTFTTQKLRLLRALGSSVFIAILALLSRTCMRG
jgi:hypothetical protein